MDPRYIRSLSPSRRGIGPERASTGHLDLYNDDYETYYAQPRGSREVLSGPRGSGERLIAPRLGPRAAYRDSLPLRRANDDYGVPQRRLGSGGSSRVEAIPISSTRRPVNVLPLGSPSRYRPIISSAAPGYSRDTRPADDEQYYLQPASSSRREHTRNYSASNSRDIGSYLSSSRALRERQRPERAGYRSSGASSGPRGSYNLNVPLVRQPRDEYDRDYGYEYTDPREQVMRDTAPRTRSRRESDSAWRERPASMSSFDGLGPRIVPSVRGAGPPPTTRGLESIGRDGTIRREYHYPRNADSTAKATPSRGADPSPRPTRVIPAVAVHQSGRVDGYASDLPSDKHRHRRAESLEKGGLNIRVPPSDRDSHRTREAERARRQPERRARDDSQDKYSRHDAQKQGDRDDVERRERRRRDEPRKDKYDSDDRRERRDTKYEDDHRKAKHAAEGAVLGAAGTAAAAGVFAASRHKHHDSSDLDSEISPKDATHPRHSDNIDRVLEKEEDSKRSSDENEQERLIRRRRRRREREEREFREREDEQHDGTPAKDKKKLTPAEIAAGGMAAGAAALAVSEEDRRASYHRLRAAVDAKDDDDSEPRRRRRRHHRKTAEQDSSSDASDEEREDRARESREIRLVSPAREAEPKPKSILRPPREKFPEDPAPVREGVAPLKDAGKKGIPPNARWTKIDRRLVNPEALDIGKERYEERVDYVIVLRVLSKPEIEQYAKLTQEIRDKRFRESQQLALEGADEEPIRSIDNRAYNNPEPSAATTTTRPDMSEGLHTLPPDSAPVNNPPAPAAPSASGPEMQESAQRPSIAPQSDEPTRSYTRVPPDYQYPPPPPRPAQ